MIRQQIDILVSQSGVPGKERVLEVIETFISWILICDRYTYKIKRPVRFSFLDFGSVEQRKNFCLQELYLNRQLAGEMYVDVLPVTKHKGIISIDGRGEVIDYAVRMRTMDNHKLMNVLLPYGRVTNEQIDELASAIAGFHSKSRVVYVHANYDLTGQFNDFAGQVPFLTTNLSHDVIEVIERSIVRFYQASKRLTHRLIQRVNLGFFRDCHGDLHSGNIYLMDKPVPFDRLEFNHELREIDVLNEVAFLCMDLEHFEEPDLAKQFFETYNINFPAVLSKEDEDIFLLYKAYRANVCAKVNSLKARQASDHRLVLTYLENVRRYVKAMSIYLDHLSFNVENRNTITAVRLAEES